MLLCSALTTRAARWEVWLGQPAAKWTEALPLGNGRMGAMVYGGVEEETIALNEQTLYGGEPVPCGKPPIHQHVAEVFDLVRAGRYAEADELVQRKMTGRLHQSYCVLGHLRLKFPHDGQATEYRRSLDLENAVATVTYRVGNRWYRREMFASAVDDVLVIRLTCDVPGSISFSATMDTPHRFARLAARDDHTVALSAKAPLYATKRDIRTIQKLGHQSRYPELFDRNGKLRTDIVRVDDRVFYAATITGPGMTFEAALRAIADGGKVRINEHGLHVENADAVTLLVAAKTSFNGFRRSPSREGADPSALCRKALDAARKPYEQLRAAHVVDYRRLFDRVKIDLGGPKRDDTPTDQRLAAYAAGSDPALEALLFQFGRYLLISSSRPGGWPANLQGLWTEDVVTPWCGAFHLDINLTMNYWPSEVTNLGECAEPMVDYVERLAANGQITAQQSYRCRGWVAHTATCIWCNTDPLDYTPVSAWNMGGTWLCRLVWDHYAFSGDRKFLATRAYPLLKGASLFCLDWLREDERGRLVTPVSASPENRFHTVDGQTAITSMASTMDMALIRELFANTIHAAEVLGCDADLRRTLQSALARLFPYQVGRYGQLQEWFKDWDRPGDNHRHLSHLWPVFPGSQISPTRTPALAAAATRSLEMRRDSEMEFSRAWRIGLWSRLGRADRAYQNVAALVGRHINPNLTARYTPRESHIFQIDGNFGFTAGIVAMLLQSRLELTNGVEVAELHLLPALATAWPNGEVCGLRASGAAVVDLHWRAGQLAKAVIRPKIDGVRRVRSGTPLNISTDGKKVEARRIEPALIEWNAERGREYVLTPERQK